jgi:hypothetical protein
VARAQMNTTLGDSFVSSTCKDDAS